MPSGDDLLGDAQGGGTGDSMYGDLTLIAQARTATTICSVITTLDTEVSL